MLDMTISQPAIEARRFILRPVRQSDAGLLQMYAGDKRVAEMTRSIAHPLPPGATEAFIRHAQSPKRTRDVWVMDGSDNSLSEVLGVISLARMDRHQSKIAYWVAPALWNAGFASEAVGTLLDANPQGCKTIFAEVFQTNPASARILTNHGFAYLGDAETFSVAKGATLPVWTYLKTMHNGRGGS